MIRIVVAGDHRLVRKSFVRLLQDLGGITIVGEAAGGAEALAFAYQGRLTAEGEPYTGDCDFEFRLYDAEQGGTLLGTVQTVSGEPVAQGLFTVELNGNGQFGPAAFNGEARWLEIRVRCPAGSTGITILEPRQPLTPAPLAHTLRPGALISGTLSGGAVLGAENNDLTGGAGVRGFTASEQGYGVAGF